MSPSSTPFHGPNPWNYSSRILVDAALAAGVAVYVQPTVTFVYPPEGPVSEETPIPDVSAILRSALVAERETDRFAQRGRRGIVLRLGLLDGPGQRPTRARRSGRAAADARIAKTVEEPTPDLAAITRIVIHVVQRRDEILKTPSGGDDLRSAADRVACAEHYYSVGQNPERVSTLLKEALAAAPSFGPALGLRAILAVDHGRLIEALPDAEKAIQAAPHSFRGYLARGRIKYERTDAAAIGDLRKAVDLSRHMDASALNALAAALTQAGMSGEAAAVRGEAIKLRSGGAHAAEHLFSEAAEKH